MTSVAAIMLIVSLLTLLVTGIPALLALAVAGARDAADNVSLIELPPVELDFTLVVPFIIPAPASVSTSLRSLTYFLHPIFPYEILAVSDGSTDHSEEQLAAILPTVSHSCALKKTKEKEPHCARVFRRAEANTLVSSTVTVTYPPICLSDLLGIIDREHPDIVYGSKRHPRSEVVYPPLRRYLIPGATNN